MAFGDSPLEAALQLIPGDRADNWIYEVDLDEDGQIDESGRVDEGVSLFYRFEAPGAHRIRVFLELEGQRFRADRIVVVNDTSPFRLRRTGGVQEAVGIAVDTALGFFYVAQRHELLEVDETTLQITRRLEFGDEIGNVAIAADGSRLFVALGRLLASVALPDFSLLQRSSLPEHAQTILGLEGTKAIIGSHGSIILMDTRTGTEEQRRQFSGVRHTAFSPDRASIAISTFDFHSAAILLIDLAEFTTIWSVELDPDLVQPAAISFSSRGDRVYVLDRGPERRLVVLEARTGRLLRNIIVGDGCGPNLCHHTNDHPSATFFNERFVVFPTEIGAYFVDTDLDLPRYRLNPGDDEHNPRGCCAVAASGAGDSVLIAGGESVLDVRIEDR